VQVAGLVPDFEQSQRPGQQEQCRSLPCGGLRPGTEAPKNADIATISDTSPSGINTATS
jgi:hypothetical protein